MNAIRLDARATDLWEGVGATDLDAQRRIFQEVRQAERVIDAQDRIIKDGTNAQVPRPATFEDIEQSRLVRG